MDKLTKALELAKATTGPNYRGSLKASVERFKTLSGGVHPDEFDREASQEDSPHHYSALHNAAFHLGQADYHLGKHGTPSHAGPHLKDASDWMDEHARREGYATARRRAGTDTDWE